MNKPGSHLGLCTTCQLFSWYCLASFALSGERIVFSTMALKYKDSFFFFSWVPVCGDCSKEKNEQLLLRTKLTFKIKTATSTEIIVKSWGGSRYLPLQNSNSLALKCGRKYEPGVCSEFRFKFRPSKATPAPPKIILCWLPLEGSF